MSVITPIYLSKKLEEVTPKELINKDSKNIDNKFGKWNATLFYVSRKKCLLMTHSLTRYSVILAGLTKDNFADLTILFTKNFTKQLYHDEIPEDELIIKNIIGELELFKTDNDRATIGTQNNILFYLDDWKYEFGDFSNWNFNEIGNRINRIPYKQLGWYNPREMMHDMIRKIKASA